MRYDMHYRAVTSQRLSRAGYNNTYPYTTGLATDIDLAVDETGLWALYGSVKHDGRLAIGRIDPHTLDVMHEWVTSFDKRQALNAFVVCGLVYIVQERVGETGGQVLLVYNTASSTMRTLSGSDVLKLDGDSLYLTMLEYNPIESMLYGWGLTRSWRGELLTYGLIVETG